jgi:GMP synthase-like glutamine amidotransferase
VDAFSCLKYYNGKVLGICAGMQLLGLIYSGELLDKLEIGFSFEQFTEDFLGVSGEIEVYHLHQHYVDFFDIDEFRVVCESTHGVAQAVVHTQLPWYGVLFHPEVRQRDMVLYFLQKG